VWPAYIRRRMVVFCIPRKARLVNLLGIQQNSEKQKFLLIRIHAPGREFAAGLSKQRAKVRGYDLKPLTTSLLKQTGHRSNSKVKEFGGRLIVTRRAVMRRYSRMFKLMDRAGPKGYAPANASTSCWEGGSTGPSTYFF